MIVGLIDLGPICVCRSKRSFCLVVLVPAICTDCILCVFDLMLLWLINDWLINIYPVRVRFSQRRVLFCSDVVLETKVLVSRRLEDKNTSLGLGLGLEIKVWVLILVLTKKSWAFSSLFRRCWWLNKKAQLMLAYPRDAKTMKKIPPFRSYNKFQSSRKSGVYSN